MLKIERKFSLLVIGVMLVVTGAIYFILHEIEVRATVSNLRTIPFGRLTVGIPQPFGPANTRDRAGWHISTFQSPKIGTFELATAPASSTGFRSNAIRYFSMGQFPEHTSIYRANGSFWFAKNMTGNTPGILVIRTRGQGRTFTYFFNHDSTSYWLSFYTGRSRKTYASLFFRVVLSLKSAGQNLLGPAFQSELSSVCRDSYFVFCQPILFFLLLPLSIALVAIWLSSIVNRKMGRLPSLEQMNALQPFYTEENASVLLKVTGKTQIVSLALTANSSGIQLYQFRKLFIELPRNKINQWEMSEGNGWFGGPYLQVKAPAAELVRAKQRFVRFTGTMTVRIYTGHPEMLRQYLL
jgi:hypothetical protein